MRELLYGPLRFNEIERGLPGISRSILSQRLKALREHGIVEKCSDANRSGYRFTEAGEELARSCAPSAGGASSKAHPASYAHSPDG